MRSSPLLLLLLSTALLATACVAPIEEDEPVPDHKDAPDKATAPDDPDDATTEPDDDGTRVLRLEIVNLTGQTVHLPDQPSRFWLRLGYGNEEYYGDLLSSLGSCTSPDCVPEPITLAPGETLHHEQDLTELLTTCERSGSPYCPRLVVLEYGSEVIQAWNPFTSTIHPYVFNLQVTDPIALWDEGWAATLRVELTEPAAARCEDTGLTGRLVPMGRMDYPGYCGGDFQHILWLTDFETGAFYQIFFPKPSPQFGDESTCKFNQHPWGDGCEVYCMNCGPEHRFHFIRMRNYLDESAHECTRLDYRFEEDGKTFTGSITLPPDHGVNVRYGECYEGE